MCHKQLLTAFFLVGLTAFGFTAPAFAAANSSMTKTTDGYKIALKVLPAEPFVSKTKASQSGNAGHMVDGSGASPMHKSSANHHLVVFIKKNGKPVEHANVKMSYEKQNASGSKMINVPVTQMWVAGKGRKTTHYGNNVKMDPGQYRVRVVVNQSAKADFNVSVQ